MPTVWPFLPNWRRQPYAMTREYRTEIITSRSGREQRRALRQTPRKRIEYLAGVQGDCLREFDRTMVTAQREQMLMPDRVRYVTLTGTMSGGAGSAVVDAVPDWLAADAEVVLVNGADQEMRTVSGIAGTTISFDETGSAAWPAGSRLHPGLRGYVDANIVAPLMSPRGVADINVLFNVDPGFEAPESTGSASTTLDGREVFLTRPNRWIPISLTRQQAGAAHVDYGFGRLAHFFPVGYSSRLFEAEWTGCDFDTSDAIRQFFDRMMGQRGEFLMPTWQRDMVPTAALTSAGTTITVSGTEVDTTFSDSTTFKAIGVRKTDGTWLLRTVSGIGTSGGNSVLTVGAAWGENVALADIDLVSWLPIWRFATDILTMRWPRLTVAEIRMSFQMLEHLAADT